MKLFDNVLFAFIVKAITQLIAVDSNLMNGRNMTEENIVSLFRSHGENLCARTDVCGHNRSTQTRSFENSGWTTCCDDCYCDDDCEFYDDCCFKTVKFIERHEDEECLYPLSDQKSKMTNNNVAFHMVTSCNKTITCYDLQKNPWGPLLPVFSPSRQKLYMNNVCATCNGVKDGKAWDSYVEFNNLSPSAVDTILSAIRFRTFTTHCHAHFIYPYDDIYALKKLQCFKKAQPIDSCPEKTALGANILQYLHQLNLDPNSIAKLCSSSFHSVYVNTETNINTYFKNVFCFICNENMIPETKCSYKLVYPFATYYNTKLVVLVAWNLDVAYVDDLPFTANGLKNKINNRVIHCPVGQYRSPEGECIYALSKWPTRGIGVFVKLLIPEPIRFPNGTTKTDIQLFFKGIEFHIDTSMSIDIVTEYANYITESDCVIIDYFAIVFRNLNVMNPSVVLNQINQILNLNWTARFHNTSVECNQVFMSHSLQSLSYFHTHDLEFLERSYNLVIIDNVGPSFKSTILKGIVLLGKIFFCSLVEFAQEEVNITYDGHVLYIPEYTTHFGDMEFVTSIDIAGKVTVKVCLDDKIFPDLKKSSVNNAKQANYQITFMFLIAYMIY